MRKKHRDIAQVADELQAALKHQTTDIIVAGGLLIEAKEMLDHGEWLPWLEVNFGSSVKTAENYMNAARFVAENRNVANLKLKPTTLYLLGGSLDDDDDDLFSPNTIAAILKAAENEWVNPERAYEIAESLKPPPKVDLKALEAERRAREAEQRERERETKEILDGPPPKLPPPEASVCDVILPQFDKAVAMLAQVQTKPLASFIGTTHTPDRIAGVAAFLNAVIAAMAKQRAA